MKEIRYQTGKNNRGLFIISQNEFIFAKNSSSGHSDITSVIQSSYIQRSSIKSNIIT